MSKSGFYRVQDKMPSGVWLTFDVASNKLKAIEVAIVLCKMNPGRAVRILPTEGMGPHVCYN